MAVAEGMADSSLASDVSHLIERLELNRVVLMGHSLGGRVAMVAAAQTPDLVAGLVVIDMSVGTPLSSSWSTNLSAAV